MPKKTNNHYLVCQKKLCGIPKKAKKAKANMLPKEKMN